MSVEFWYGVLVTVAASAVFYFIQLYNPEVRAALDRVRYSGAFLRHARYARKVQRHVHLMARLDASPSACVAYFAGHFALSMLWLMVFVFGVWLREGERSGTPLVELLREYLLMFPPLWVFWKLANVALIASDLIRGPVAANERLLPKLDAAITSAKKARDARDKLR